jgi:hypothetical protein
MTETTTYVAPARRVLTFLHRPDPATAPGIDALTGVAADGWTACGRPMLTDELWVPVEYRDGDPVCPACCGPGPAAQDVQEALL